MALNDLRIYHAVVTGGWVSLDGRRIGRPGGLSLIALNCMP